MANLVAYDWPGNVRELQHVVERAVILAPTGRAIHFDVTPLPAARSGPPASVRPYRTAHEWRRMERDNLLAALKAARGKVTGPDGAAALLGVNPNTLASRLRVLGLKKTFVEQRDASR
jgi:transcriptional regulator of acetoin/glycerol metabolism